MLLLDNSKVVLWFCLNVNEFAFENKYNIKNFFCINYTSILIMKVTTIFLSFFVAFTCNSLVKKLLILIIYFIEKNTSNVRNYFDFAKYFKIML